MPRVSFREMFDSNVSDDALRLLEGMLVFSGRGGRVRRRPEQADHGEGSAGIGVSAVDSKAGDGDRDAHAHAVPLRVRLDERRGGEASIAKTHLSGGHAVPVDADRHG